MFIYEYVITTCDGSLRALDRKHSQTCFLFQWCSVLIGLRGTADADDPFMTHTAFVIFCCSMCSFRVKIGPRETEIGKIASLSVHLIIFCPVDAEIKSLFLSLC